MKSNLLILNKMLNLHGNDIWKKSISIHHDPSHPGSFKGVNKLHEAIKDSIK